jgi:pSer/pThr/pTyr-binding forkhead associated (FHA) protein
MLRRITEHVDPGLPRDVELLQLLLRQPVTPGVGLPGVTIGRHPRSNIVLSAVSIPLLLSRDHAEITYDGEQFVVKDLDTTNGTYVRPARRLRRAACARSRTSGLSSNIWRTWLS